MRWPSSANLFTTSKMPDDLAYAAAELLGKELEVSRAGYGTIDVAAETFRSNGIGMRRASRAWPERCSFATTAPTSKI